MCVLFRPDHTRPNQNQIKWNSMNFSLASLVIAANIILFLEKMFCLVYVQQQSLITMTISQQNLLNTYYVKLMLNQIGDLVSSSESWFKFIISKIKLWSFLSCLLWPASASMPLVHFCLWNVEHSVSKCRKTHLCTLES